ncbi:putative competence-damage inducible protein [Clostridium pasteurianum DSM 525 = ATCC 6013]|uniref:Putative competence-damage inducible protein n=1 Tax=Clostridium pasteurianum DSM 525 = ATCC 6013 TaxID=1262449 RepID=A0A0H3J923_CLOPA|nr:competence/damage-inducible protein A [Clostridium pasteurianum]AJA50004.1 putative competence-damage inducible protein [Clostridium pasteurianum DSM 525 = ATCC 6013]AJA53992.1 putative competence-damage inducible protein [Clostridium pasteurianum DSM 525 = ATCC 6013]AOZ77135.1 damage-inducible protein CinA [Clostridium pasteurianum DSM 525 = ATCC 6013]AOZ80932.1 damage-inducible protein CinA [Clostridium pasteurianum]ELP59286.1 competence damage-inducible protein A [Clostridium pasteurianu
MKAEILSVGTELLLGDILNTNAQYISRELANFGINVYYQTVVGDNPERLKNAYNFALNRADIVITTGGLGPTKDDLTKEIAAEYFNKKLVLDNKSLQEIITFFKKINREISENNKKQAYFPEGSIIIENNNGTAPGCIIEENNKIAILLPGPPKEMIPMLNETVIPYLKKFHEGTLVSKVLRITGIGESSVDNLIGHIIDNQTNPTVAPYAKDNEVILRLTAKTNNEEEAYRIIEPVERQIRNKLGDINVYGVENQTIEGVVAKLLIENKLTISTAESCTGGLLAGQLINYPGISSAFLEGAVTYSNKAKINRLKVKEDTLIKFGAVSSECAAEMAEGIAKESGTNIGVSTTGIAGPDGGTDEKPVGLVYVGIYINGIVKTKKLNLVGNRQKIRDRAVAYTLDWIRRELIKYLKEGNN